MPGGAVAVTQRRFPLGRAAHLLLGTSPTHRLAPVTATDSFWFYWAAFHPDTAVTA
jgi:Protein of unknown function (DUF3179)